MSPAKENGNLLKSSLVVSAMTFVSRILGLVRDVVLAHFIGASLFADVFLLAQKIPNFMRRLFAEGAFSQAFVPVLNETLTHDNHQAVQQLVNRVASLLGTILLLITILGVLGSNGLASVFGFGFVGDSQKFPLLSLMIKVTFPYLMFISLTAFAGGILNSYQHFAGPAITPVFLNVSLITAAVFVAPNLEMPVMALPWAVFVAGVVQLLFQLPFLWKLDLLPRPVLLISPNSWKLHWQDSRVRKMIQLLTPALFGVSVVQINLLLDSMIASFLKTGSISWLYYSDRLLEFPLGIFGIAIATVVLPSLSRKHSENSGEDFSNILDWSLKLVLMIGIPAAVAMIFLAEPLMLTLFQRGEFTPLDATLASQSLIAYSVGLIFFMLIKVLAPGYYARQDTKTPVKIALKAVVANMILNIILFYPLAHVGLALATSLSAMLNASLLFWGLKNSGIYHKGHPWMKWSLQVFLSTVVMWFALKQLSPELKLWQENGTGFRIQWMSILVISGMAVYTITLWLSGVRFRQLIHRE